MNRPGVLNTCERLHAAGGSHALWIATSSLSLPLPVPLVGFTCALQQQAMRCTEGAPGHWLAQMLGACWEGNQILSGQVFGGDPPRRMKVEQPERAGAGWGQGALGEGTSAVLYCEGYCRGHPAFACPCAGRTLRKGGWVGGGWGTMLIGREGGRTTDRRTGWRQTGRRGGTHNNRRHHAACMRGRR